MGKQEGENAQWLYRSELFTFGNKPGKMISRLAKGKRESTFITALQTPLGEVTSNSKQINLILRNFYETLYSRGEEMDSRKKGLTFLSKISLPLISADQLDVPRVTFLNLRWKK